MDLMAVDGTKSVLKARTQYTKEKKLVEVSCLLHCDLVILDRLLLNGIPLTKCFTNRETVLFLLLKIQADNCGV